MITQTIPMRYVMNLQPPQERTSHWLNKTKRSAPASPSRGRASVMCGGGRWRRRLHTRAEPRSLAQTSAAPGACSCGCPPLEKTKMLLEALQVMLQ